MKFKQDDNWRVLGKYWRIPNRANNDVQYLEAIQKYIYKRMNNNAKLKRVANVIRRFLTVLSENCHKLEYETYYILDGMLQIKSDYILASFTIYLLETLA